MTTATIHDTQTINAIIELQEACGYGFRNPIYRAALAGELGAVIEALPHSRVPREALWHKAPTVAVIADDAGLSSGPSDFPDAERLFGWARRVMIHAAGGEAFHYEWVVEAARLFGRVVMVETTTAAEAAWMALAERERDRREAEGREPFGLLLIQVPSDKPPHPVVPTGTEGGAQ